MFNIIYSTSTHDLTTQTALHTQPKPTKQANLIIQEPKKKAKRKETTNEGLELRLISMIRLVGWFDRGIRTPQPQP